MPFARRRSASGRSARVSASVTTAPRETSRSAAARPLFPAPTTSTCCPRTSKLIASPQLQREQTEEREDDREDQKPRDDLRFLPADEFEVMVERRHSEDTLAAHLVRRHLDDDRAGFEHE